MKPQLLLILVLSFAPSWAGTIYSLDDGTGESTYVAGGVLYWFWYNAYQVVPGGETITAIQLAFHPEAPVGRQMTAYLWRDPNNDGNPADGVVVASAAGTIPGTGNVFFDFPITPYTFSPGDWFFAGAGIYYEANERISYLDESNSGNAWVSLNTTNDPNDLDAFFFDLADIAGGVWMARAVGEAAVPEPQAGVLVMAGLGILVSLRRRRPERRG